MKDSEIIKLYFARNEDAIPQTADKYGNYCHTIAHNILHNFEDSEECVSDTWFAAWNSIPPKIPNILSAYLGKITRNLSLNRCKIYSAQKRGLGQTPLVFSELEDCVSNGETPETAFEQAEITEAINKFLYKTEQPKCNIFIRRYFYFYSVKEIAATYKMSESKVTSLLFRTRNELKDFLIKEGINL